MQTVWFGPWKALAMAALLVTSTACGDLDEEESGTATETGGQPEEAETVTADTADQANDDATGVEDDEGEAAGESVDDEDAAEESADRVDETGGELQFADPAAEFPSWYPDGNFGHEDQIDPFATPYSDPPFEAAPDPADAGTVDCRTDAVGDLPDDTQYLPLIDFGYVEVDEPGGIPELEELAVGSGEEAVRRVDYVNDDDDSVSLYVAGTDPTALDAFLAEARVCFSLSEDDGSLGQDDTTTVDVGKRIVDATARLLVISAGLELEFQSALARYRDSLTVGDDILHYGDLVSLMLSEQPAELFEYSDIDGETLASLTPDDFIVAAAVLLEDDLRADTAIDEDPQQLALDMVVSRFFQPDAQFLVDPDELPSGAAGTPTYSQILNVEESPILVVLVPDTSGFGTEVRVDFAIDPTVNRRQKIYYRAKCIRTAKVSTHVEAGAATVFMYQWGPYRRHGNRYASSPWNTSSGQIKRTRKEPSTSFDVKVKGWQNGSQYDIFGWWVQGSGGTC